jgi:hypothetical protein
MAHLIVFQSLSTTFTPLFPHAHIHTHSLTPHTHTRTHDPLPPQDAATAKKLAFSREVERRCVTLEGDDFNPKGLLTGGARQQVTPPPPRHRP